MQAIERYGVVALLLLIGTVVAVLVWDGTPAGPETPVAYADEPAAPYDSEARAESGRIGLSGRPENRALTRDVPLESAQGDLRSDHAAGRVIETTGRHEEEAWTPPASAYTPARRDPSGVDFAPEEQPEYYEPEPADLEPFVPYREEDRSEVVERVEREPAPAAGARTVAASGSTKGRRYTIRSGDTLGQISLDQLGTSRRWREIVELNPGLDAKRLFVGKEIVLPPASSGATTVAATKQAPRSQAKPQPAAEPSKGPTYTVQNGDNLWKIAARTLGDRERWHEIRDLNPSIDPDKILVGQKLVLPVDPRTVREPIVASGKDTGTGQSRRVR